MSWCLLALPTIADQNVQGKEYNISNEALIGAFFLPQGLGNISGYHANSWAHSNAHPHSYFNAVGAPTAGRMSDRTVIYWRKRRGGKWVPEDRLRAALWGAGFFTPVSVLLAGITIKYVPGTPGIILNLIWLFMNGIGVRPHPALRIIRIT